MTMRHMAARAAALLERTSPRWLALGFELAGKLADRLPDRDATPLRAALAMVACADIVRTTVFPANANPVAAYVARFGLREVRSEAFVRVFFGTDIQKRFSIGEVRVSDYSSIIEARSPILGHVAFVRYDHSDGPESRFYVSEGLQMPKVLSGLWETYGGRIHVSLRESPYGPPRTEFGPYMAEAEPMLGEADEKRLHRYVDRHRRYARIGSPRTYMLWGASGTGKTSFAIRLVNELGGRLLKLNAGSLAQMTTRDMLFLVENLSPDFVLVDDVDKAWLGSGLPALLDLLQAMKRDRSGVGLILTANEVGGFDPGMMRPGRIDTWIEFALPDAKERAAIIRRYGLAYPDHVRLTQAEVRTLAGESDGLSPDHLRELVMAVRAGETLPQVHELAATMRRIATQKSEPTPATPTSHAVSKEKSL